MLRITYEPDSDDHSSRFSRREQEKGKRNRSREIGPKPLASSGGSVVKRIIVSLALLASFTLAQDVTLDVIGFRVPPNEVGTPLDQAYQAFITQFEANNPGVKINALESPPEFDTYILTALASNTAPDVWSQDGSSLAKVAGSGQLLDMKRCTEAVPKLHIRPLLPDRAQVAPRL